jgi:hypothetical protein
MAWRSAQLGGDLNRADAAGRPGGLGLFVITLLSGELAGRLAREELAARGSLELARQQAQLNRLVIEEMVDGVLVVDHRPARACRQPGGARTAGRAGPGAVRRRFPCRRAAPGCRCRRRWRRRWPTRIAPGPRPAATSP